MAEKAYVVFLRYSKVKMRVRDQSTCAASATAPEQKAVARTQRTVQRSAGGSGANAAGDLPGAESEGARSIAIESGSASSATARFSATAVNSVASSPSQPMSQKPAAKVPMTAPKVLVA